MNHNNPTRAAFGVLDSAASATKGMVGRRREDGNVYVVDEKTGESVTRIDANVYPVGSNKSARYEHPEGIVLTMADAKKLGLYIARDGE